MQQVTLTGHLVCRDDVEAACVAQYLPAHVALTRAEAGCLEFVVEPTSDPLVWRVEERFTDEAAFNSHQMRVASSDWGRATKGIERRYTITGISD